MSDLQNLNEILEQSSRDLNSLNSVIGTTISNKKILNLASKEEVESTKENKEKLDKFSRQLQGTVSGLIRFAKSTQDTAGSFAPLGDIIIKAGDITGGVAKTLLKSVPLLGSAIDAGAKAVAQVTAHMVNEFDKAYTTFEKLSGSGVVDSFTMFEQSAGAMGLTFSDFDRVMAKGSKDLALLGGGAIQGTKMMQLVGAGSEHLRTQFQRLGINSAEVTEFQLSYLTQRQQMNRGRLVIDQNLIAASGEYVKELDLVAKITGLTRKEADQNRKELMQDSVVRANFEKITPGAQDNFKLLNDSMISFTKDKEMSHKILKVMLSGQAHFAPELVSAAKAGGVDMILTGKKLKEGKISMRDAGAQIFTALEKFSKDNLDLSAIGASSPLFQFLAKSADGAIAFNKMTNEEIAEMIKNQNDQTRQTTGLNSALADSKQNLYKSSQKLEKLSVSSDMVAATMKHMSKAMYWMISKANKAAGIENPEHIERFEQFMKVQDERMKAEQAENAITERIKKLRDKEGKSEKLILKQEALAKKMEKDIESNKNKILDLKKREKEKEKEFIQAQIKAGIREADTTTTTDKPTSRSSAPPQPPPSTSTSAAPASAQPSQPSTGSAATNPADAAKNLTTVRSKSGAGAQVNKQYAGAFQKVVDYLDSTGYNIYSMGGYNDRNIAGTNTKSIHAYGGAIDINPRENPMGSRLVTDMPKDIGQIAKNAGLGWGGNWTSPKDAMHFSAAKREGGNLLQARTGGIFSGPESGYLAELHGDEAIISPQSASKQALNSTVSGVTGPSSRENLLEIYENLSDKMERLVSLMSDQHDSQIKYMESQES